MKVKISHIPVRYKGETHVPGSIIEIQDAHYNESIMERVETPKAPAKRKKKSSEEDE